VLLGAAVTYVVAKAIPSVPGTAGRAKGAAISVLRAAGYRVLVTSQTRTSGTEGTVLRQSPVGGTRMKPGGTVRLVVAHVVRPVAAVPSSCSTGYRPCLPPASDYDCAGGSGDGPAYANGPIYVTGSDPYDLDSEGDGIACE
jgi:beta-lactam-binding protein with PASTA domain